MVVMVLYRGSGEHVGRGGKERVANQAKFRQAVDCIPLDLTEPWRQEHLQQMMTCNKADIQALQTEAVIVEGMVVNQGRRLDRDRKLILDHGARIDDLCKANKAVNKRQDKTDQQMTDIRQRVDKQTLALWRVVEEKGRDREKLRTVKQDQADLRAQTTTVKKGLSSESARIDRLERQIKERDKRDQALEEKRLLDEEKQASVKAVEDAQNGTGLFRRWTDRMGWTIPTYQALIDDKNRVQAKNVEVPPLVVEEEDKKADEEAEAEEEEEPLGEDHSYFEEDMRALLGDPPSEEPPMKKPKKV